VLSGFKRFMSVLITLPSITACPHEATIWYLGKGGGKGKCKCKVVPVLLTEHRAVKAYWGSGDIAPHILDLDNRWEVSGQFYASATLSPGKEPWYPLGRRLCGSQNRSGQGGEEKNSQPLPALEPSDYPARSPTLYHWAILTLESYILEIS
jgi:hypothetical protein